MMQMNDHLFSWNRDCFALLRQPNTAETTDERSLDSGFRETTNAATTKGAKASELGEEESVAGSGTQARSFESEI